MPRAIRTRKMEGHRDAAFAALSDASRRRILELLGTGEKRVTELAEHFEISRPAVSKHLAVLSRAGLVTFRKVGRDNWYRILPQRLQEAVGYVRDVEDFWSAGLARLDKRLGRS
jgi:DNA-binding transcriptional ArsR family regulator